MGPQSRLGELATLMLVAAAVAGGFQVVMAGDDLRTRILGTSAEVLIGLVIGLRHGRYLYRRERHAIVTQNSGEVVSIPIPAHIDPDDAHTYVLVQLNEGRS
jgi:hypothetical protein